MNGLLLDLSVRGCCVEWAEPAPVGTGSGIEIRLNVKGNVLRLMGVIRYVHRKKRTGIEFSELSPRKQQQIDAVITDYLEMRRLAHASR